MISTTELQEKVSCYQNHCRMNHIPVSYNGISELLGISRMTVSNVVHGSYNGKRYGSRPHATRKINNSDFKILQELFEGEGDYCE